MAFVAVTNTGTLTSTYNSFPKQALASYTSGGVNNTYIVDAWGFPIIYLAYGSGFFPNDPHTGQPVRTYNRPFLVSGGTPRLAGVCNINNTFPNALPSPTLSQVAPFLYSFDEMPQ
jgi:hypothetical protein